MCALVHTHTYTHTRHIRTHTHLQASTPVKGGLRGESTGGQWEIESLKAPGAAGAVADAAKLYVATQTKKTAYAAAAAVRAAAVAVPAAPAVDLPVLVMVMVVVVVEQVGRKTSV